MKNLYLMTLIIKVLRRYDVLRDQFYYFAQFIEKLYYRSKFISYNYVEIGVSFN